MQREWGRLRGCQDKFISADNLLDEQTSGDALRSIQKIFESSARVAVLEVTTQRRSIIINALRNRGFSRFSPVRTFDEIKEESAERSQIDFCIGVFDAESIRDAVDEVRWLYNCHDLVHMRISILCSRKDGVYIPLLFESGILSYHFVEWDIDAVVHQIRGLQNLIKKCRFDETYVSASYLRSILKKIKKFEELVNLEESFEKDFKDHRVNSLELAEAYFLTGRELDGIRMLDRGSYLHSSAKSRAKRMEEYFTKDLNLSISFGERNSIYKALVVDSDQSYLDHMGYILRRMGVGTIEYARSGDEGWEKAIQISEPDLIVTEWYFDFGISGYTFIQRIRNAGMNRVPVVVLSKSLSKEYSQLFTDLNIFQIIVKPSDRKKMLLIIAWTITQSVRPTEPKTIERRILYHLHSSEYGDAFHLKRRLSGHPGASVSRLKYLEGVFSYIEKDYEKSEKLLDEAMKLSSSRSVDIMSLLGTVLWKLGQYDKALDILRTAADISPLNIDRICSVADLLLELGRVSESDDYLSRAKKIDVFNVRYITSMAKRALYFKNDDELSLLLDQLKVSDSVFGFLNNLAVSAIRNRDFELGIEYYQRSLSYINDRKSVVYAVIHYNLGLAFVKIGRPKASRVHLERAIENGHTRILSKARSLLDRIRDRLEDGVDLELDGDDLGVSENPIQTGISVEIALLGIYKVSDPELRNPRRKEDRSAS